MLLIHSCFYSVIRFCKAIWVIYSWSKFERVLLSRLIFFLSVVKFGSEFFWFWALYWVTFYYYFNFNSVVIITQFSFFPPFQYTRFSFGHIYQIFMNLFRVSSLLAYSFQSINDAFYFSGTVISIPRHHFGGNILCFNRLTVCLRLVYFILSSYFLSFPIYQVWIQLLPF